MKKITIKELEELMLQALNIRGIYDTPAQLIIQDFLGSQLEGRLTHGIGKFLLLDSSLNNRKGSPSIIKEDDCFALINGNRELGQLAAIYAVDVLKKKVRSKGVGVVGMNNAGRYSRLSVIGELIAKEGIVGIIMNNAGPAAVTPFQGIEPILGTNPICFAIPCEEQNLIMDFSTAEKTWGEIRQATLENKNLPKNAFLDSNGEFTLNPDEANAVLPFGGAKGYALCLAIEILTGALVSAQMGLDVDSQYDLGFLFIGIDVNIFSKTDLFKSSVGSLLNQIRNSKSQSEKNKVRIPGENSKTKVKKALKDGYVHIDDESYSRLIEMSKGIQGGLKSSNKLD